MYFKRGQCKLVLRKNLWKLYKEPFNKPNPFILDHTLIERAYFFDSTLHGDINQDGMLNILDIVALVTIILNNDNNNMQGDLNNDNLINVLDIVMLASIILS